MSDLILERAQDGLVESEADCYPSRDGQNAQLIGRQDPTIQQSGEVITEPNGNDLRSIFRVHENSPIFNVLAADERLAGLARYILDDEVYNALSNRVVNPFCAQVPRPEYICSRKNIYPVPPSRGCKLSA